VASKDEIGNLRQQLGGIRTDLAYVARNTADDTDRRALDEAVEAMATAEVTLRKLYNEAE
jgi:hypothetical protein